MTQVVISNEPTPLWVVSTIIHKQVCIAGGECTNAICYMAHPNKTSICRTPRWCLRGSISTCLETNCPFNHFVTEEGYQSYYENKHPKTSEQLRSTTSEPSNETPRNHTQKLNPNAVEFKPLINSHKPHKPHKSHETPKKEKKTNKQTSKKQKKHGYLDDVETVYILKKGEVYYAPHPHKSTVADFIESGQHDSPSESKK